MRGMECGLLLCSIAIAAVAPGARGGEGAEGVEGVTAVSSRASKDYMRAKLPDGSWQPESYAFGEGGQWKGAMNDPAIDNLRFLDVARMIASPLASRRYLPGRDPKTTRLLIMVYWGTTSAPEHASESGPYQRLMTMPFPHVNYRAGNSRPSFLQEDVLMAAMQAVALENEQRDKVDNQNAALLGYDSWWEATERFEGMGFGFGYERQDMIDELEHDRYFVVLMAYDFELLWKEKRHTLLWETRFSIDQHHNEFNKALPAMAQYASQYFGEDSHGLLRMRVPEGNVDVRAPTLIELLETKK